METGRRVHRFTIGDRLRKAREVAGFDQRGFEAASGISRATIGAYELGKSTPRRAYLSIWANVTDTDLDWLMYGDDCSDLRQPDDPSGEGHNSGMVSTDDASRRADRRKTSSPAQAHPAEGPSI